MVKSVIIQNTSNIIIKHFTKLIQNHIIHNLMVVPLLVLLNNSLIVPLFSERNTLVTHFSIAILSLADMYPYLKLIYTYITWIL